MQACPRSSFLPSSLWTPAQSAAPASLWKAHSRSMDQWNAWQLALGQLAQTPRLQPQPWQPLALTDGRGGRGSPRTLCGVRGWARPQSLPSAHPCSPAPAGTSLGKDRACRVGWGLPQLPQGRCHPRNLSLCKYWGCGELAAHPAALPPPQHSADVHGAAANCEMNCQSAELSFE